MAALDLLGRRWVLRILWELRQGPLGARALQSRCADMSSSVLYVRLHELAAAGLVAKEADGYLLTDLGTSLGPALDSLNTWAKHWSATIEHTSEATAPKRKSSQKAKPLGPAS